ncbi:hypothetical protein EDC96DRAFT_547894 [Choanephora cucurbitarum]|nr:hypothetical protein EDC96DRAFT_547894 [Choanephora cucurbitarum]
MYARLLPNLGLLRDNLIVWNKFKMYVAILCIRRTPIDAALTCLKRLKRLKTYQLIHINKNVMVFSDVLEVQLQWIHQGETVAIMRPLSANSSDVFIVMNVK